MEEPPGGASAGRAASPNPNVEGRYVPLDADAVQAHDFVRAGGWTIVTDKDGSRAGIHAHRGVLHAEEYVDPVALRAAVETQLGFTFDALHSVYSTGGRISNDLRELRERIDARVLALSRLGANMDALARVTGITPRTLDRALARAKAAELPTEGSK